MVSVQTARGLLGKLVNIYRYDGSVTPCVRVTKVCEEYTDKVIQYVAKKGTPSETSGSVRISEVSRTKDVGFMVELIVEERRKEAVFTQ